MKPKFGIGYNRGYYFTSKQKREYSKSYTNAHDRIQLVTPLGTRDRIKDLGIKPKQLFLELAEAYISEQKEQTVQTERKKQKEQSVSL